MLSAVDPALRGKHTTVRSAVATMGDFRALNSVTVREEMPSAIFIRSLSRRRRRRKKRRKRKRRRRRIRRKSFMKTIHWPSRKLTLNKK